MDFGYVHKVGLCAVMSIILLSTACSATVQSQDNQARHRKSMTREDINAVLKGHEKKLLTTSGVVGVYVGLLSDDETPCLKVVVVKETEDLMRRIPRSIEGYPVLIEESGVIQPLKD